jgi:hypothetical protein
MGGGTATADAGRAAASQAVAGATAIGSIIAQMRRSSIASSIIDRLGGDAEFERHVSVLSDSEFQRRFQGATGVFLPDSNRIYIPASALRGDAGRAALTLAHEGLHLLQDAPGGVQEGGADALGQALVATGAIDGGGGKLGNQRDEAQAYTIEARIAQELGVIDRGLGTSNGRALSYAATLSRVQSHPVYA